MTTDRQRVANRSNARKSTGPRTGPGKAIVRLNAVRHGLRAATAVVPGFESPAEWEQFRAGVVASLQPAGALAEALAERAAGLLCRLRRAERFESLSVAADQAELEIPRRPRTGDDALNDDDEDRMTDAELLADRERSVADAHAKLARYEPAGRLAKRLKGMDDDAPVDAAEAVAFLAACADQARAADADDPVPHPDDNAALLLAAGGNGDADLVWTAGLLRKTASLFAAAIPKKRSADWLIREVVESADQWVEDSRSTIEMYGPEAEALRRRVELRAAVARARRAGVNPVAAVHVARYEGHLQRQLNQTLDELDRVRRSAGPVVG